jgi:hypothetical protein
MKLLAVAWRAALALLFAFASCVAYPQEAWRAGGAATAVEKSVPRHGETAALRRPARQTDRKALRRDLAGSGAVTRSVTRSHSQRLSREERAVLHRELRMAIRDANDSEQAQFVHPPLSGGKSRSR